MHHDYRDIIDPMTELLRRSHANDKELGHGPSSDCPDEIDPTTERCTCVATPLWHDEHGTPRFAPHHPELCADIYAREVALLEIACQGCERRFRVQVSVSAHDFLRAHDAAMTLESLITTGIIHYGDPPNVGCCPSGPTMSANDLRVLEYWRHTDGAWSRIAGLEVSLNVEVSALAKPIFHDAHEASITVTCSGCEIVKSHQPGDITDDVRLAVDPECPLHGERHELAPTSREVGDAITERLEEMEARVIESEMKRRSRKMRFQDHQFEGIGDTCTACGRERATRVHIERYEPHAFVGSSTALECVKCTRRRGDGIHTSPAADLIGKDPPK